MNVTATLDLEILLRDTFERFEAQRDGAIPPNLSNSMSYSLLSPGKRIRPRILLACGEMLGLSTAELVPAAMALEMVHCFTLIHDDLPCMDDDDFRRGMLSNHKKFGEALALLAGDGLMALAVEVFLESPVSPPLLLQGLKRMAWAMGPRGVIGGQAAESLLGTHSKFEDLRAMHRQKTGTLFSAALLIPKDFADLKDETQEGQALIEFADALGFAFQIADDLEDLLKEPPQEPTKQNAEMHNPTHILTYLSKKEAQELVKKSLTAAADGLFAIWGEASRQLIQVADEVILKSLI